MMPLPTRKIRLPRLFLLALALIAAALAGAPTVREGPTAPTTQPWRSLRLPRAEFVADVLQSSGALALDAPAELMQQAVADWYEQTAKAVDLGPAPAALQRLLAGEAALLQGDVAAASRQLAAQPTNILAVVVEFAGTDTITRLYPDQQTGGCVQQTAIFGPLFLGDDPPPGPRDNFAFYKPGIGPADYAAALFGVGADAPGYGVIRPDLGGIDLKGLTLNNYLLEMSRGTYQVGGSALPEPLSLPHSHEYYGHALYEEDMQGRCQSPPGSDANFAAFALDTAAALISAHGASLDWSQFDANGDGVVDLVFVIHAGYGWQDRGDPDRLSSSSTAFSLMGLPRPQVAGQDTPGDASDDYFLDAFVVLPEQLDLGAMHEEFAHYLGLPDLYTLDADTSNGFWGALAAGVWGGPVGGARPVGHNLWQDWLLGWRSPRVINHNDPEVLVELGRARNTPAGAEDGLIIRLPDKEVLIENKAGAGQGWWSGADNNLDQRVQRPFDLRGAGSDLRFSFDAFWDIERGWDYGYVEISTDGGATWASLPDEGGLLTRDNPHGRNLGWGLTGQGRGRLRFALDAYRDQIVHLRLRYVTDATRSRPGWWVDNFSLVDQTSSLYSNALEDGFGDWTHQGWFVTPHVDRSMHYYLVEWRDDSGFDRSLNDPYQVVFADEDTHELKINRMPATTPGLLILYRDLSRPFDYDLLSGLDDPPSYGPKYGLLVVESYFEPLRFDTTFPSFQHGWAGVPLSGRVLPGDGLFGLTPQRSWTARLGLNFETGQWLDTPLETKTWPQRPPRPAFHDALSYVPGFFYPGSGSLVFLHDWDASAVIPAGGDYATPITTVDGAALPGLYGVEIAPGRTLGSGHPGDAGVQYGLHIEVVEQSAERATVRVWHALYEFDGETAVSPPAASAGEHVTFEFAARNVGKADEFFAFVALPEGATYVEGSVTGDFWVVGGSQQALLAAWRQGEMPAQVADSGQVVGFAYLGRLGAGQRMAGGFGVRVEPGGGRDSVAAELVFYQRDGTPVRGFTATAPLLNAAPQVEIITQTTELDEGDLFSVVVAFSDPDSQAWTAEIDFGDGAQQRLQLDAAQPFSLTHRYVQDGAYLFSVTIRDERDSGAASLPITVRNVAPAVTFAGDSALLAGQVYTGGGHFVDPGQDTWSATVDFGDGSGAQPLALADDKSFVLEHVYAAGGRYMITVRVHDGRDEGAASAAVTVLERRRLPLVADTFVSSGTPDENYHRRPDVIARSTGVDNILLVFDRSDLPPAAEIISATVTLDVRLESGAFGKTMAVLNSAAFDPAAVTFRSAPLTFNPGATAAVQLGALRLEAQDQVAAWDQLDGGPWGFLALALVGPPGRVVASSLESWPPGRQASLEVVFVP